MRGKTVCRIHGGEALEGFEHPNFKHGMYTASLKNLGLGKHYATALADPMLMTLGNDTALITGRIFELIEQMAAGEGPVAWEKALESALGVRDTLLAVHAAMQAPSSPTRGSQIAAALKTHEQTVAAHVDIAQRGASTAETWPLITEQIYLRKKLVDSEVKRQKAGAEVMLKAQVLTLLKNIVMTVQRHVTDPRQKQAVVNDMRQCLGGSGE